MAACSELKSMRELMARDGPLILMGAHDALSAKLIEHAGFDAYMIGGFPLVGARYAVPDIGLKGLGEIAVGVRDIISATRLPVLVDIDDGYGDVKNVVHTVHTYELMGAAALMIEDQKWPKRCGHMAGKTVVPIEEMEAKLRAALAERINRDTFIWARTDARGPLGLEEAVRRAERYLSIGADGIFIEAPRSIEELERIGKTFAKVPQIANPLEGGLTPLLKPNELHELGFKVIGYGTNLLMRVVRTLELALADIRDGKFALMGTGVGLADYIKLLGYEDWARLEDAYGHWPEKPK
jgi:2-methylisocitrate lyase-like PEP mutase family enzyme